MTQTFAVDGNSDLYLGADGNIAIVSGAQAVLQNVAHAVKTILGEMLFAVDQGLPYFEALWTGTPNLAQYEAAWRGAVLALDGVMKINSLTLTQTGNTLNYSAEIETVYGVGTVNG